MDYQQLDVIAVGAHPDDVEIGCGGSLARLVQQGYRVGIVDLTDGEPTPRSTGPEARLAEARLAAKTLGALVRVTLDLPNRRLFDSFESRALLATEFRKYRPRLVLGLGSKTALASPDHYQANLITEAAVFYSRLTKWDEHFGGLAPHTVPSLMYYFLGLRLLLPFEANHVVVDISSTLQTKIEAVACYGSQFAHRPEILDRIRAFNQQQGMAAGFEAGEVMASPTALATRDLMGLVFSLEPKAEPQPLPPTTPPPTTPPPPEIGAEAVE
jgi:N-acetylglucosamine malate deacetylase 1